MTTIKKVKKIMYKPEIIQRLCNDFRCSRGAVYYALRKVSNSNQAKAIREKALNEYGAVETTVKILE